MITDYSLILCFYYSLSKYLVRTYYVLDTRLDAGDTAVNNMDLETTN